MLHLCTSVTFRTPHPCTRCMLHLCTSVTFRTPHLCACCACMLRLSTSVTFRMPHLCACCMHAASVHICHIPHAASVHTLHAASVYICHIPHAASAHTLPHSAHALHSVLYAQSVISMCRRCRLRSGRRLPNGSVVSDRRVRIPRQVHAGCIRLCHLHR